MNPEKIKHLEFLQAIITRMNTNSFQIKTMCVTLVSASLGFAFTLKNMLLMLVHFMPIIIFWALDTYYLWQERKFRGVYEAVAGLDKIHNIAPFSMPIHKFTGEKYSYMQVLISPTLSVFYAGMLFLLGTIVFIYIVFICYIKIGSAVSQ